MPSSNNHVSLTMTITTPCEYSREDTHSSRKMTFEKLKRNTWLNGAATTGFQCLKLFKVLVKG